MATIKQLQERIARERKKVVAEQRKQKLSVQKQSLQIELLKLKNRKALSATKKGLSIVKKGAAGIFKVGKKAAPVIAKQARLIREQQLRDDAIARGRAKRSGQTTKKVSQFIPVKRKGKRTLFKKVKIKVRVPKTVRKQKTNPGIFESIDF